MLSPHMQGVFLAFSSSACPLSSLPAPISVHITWPIGSSPEWLVEWNKSSTFWCCFGVFSMSQLFISDGQSIGTSASALVLSVNIQGWFRLGLTSLISFLSKGLSRVFASTTLQKHQFFSTQPSLWSNSHIHIWLLEKPSLQQYRPLLAKWCLWFLICCLDLS